MTDNDIKYKATFGDMAQFNGMMPDCVFISGEYGYKIVEDTLYYCERYNERYGWAKSCVALEDFKPAAMRHIIKAPTWTKADQEKGILPTVGCELRIGSDLYIVEAINSNEGQLCVRDKSDGELSITYRQYIKPIETPREKYDRERDECINKLISELPRRPVSQKHILNSLYEELRPFTGDDHD